MTIALDKITTRQRQGTLIEEALLPTSLAQRPISAYSYAWIWIGIAVIIATYSLGASGVQNGASLSTVILTIFAANVCIGLFMLLTADIGTEHGLTFAVYLRAPFGIYGTHLPAVSRGVVAAMWFGIQTYLGALALNGIGSHFLGIDNWFLWYLIFGLVQVINTALGIKAIEKLAALAAPCIIAISIWMYLTLDNIAQVKGINIWNFAAEGNMSLLALFLVNLAFWSTMAIDIPNLTRFLKTQPGTKSFARRNKNLFGAQLIALPLTQAFIAGIGGISYIATGNWNPIEVIQAESQGFALVALLALVVLAQWSTNTAANLVPSALTLVNLSPRYINYKTGVALAGIIGTLCFPWLILDNLFVFLNYYGAFLASIGGIMIADYYIIRRRRLNVPELFHSTGQFRYSNGINWAGLIAWAISGGVAAYFSAYAFLIGFPLGLVCYTILMKVFVLPRYPQKEIDSNFSDDFLATSKGYSWVYQGSGAFTRLSQQELTQTKITREDI
ncbi:NCS1 family transporter [Pseudochrobactrum sp. MP213Fo]|uniref:NCS1 family transporter n=1 Tax=Pseudochrobactrum sp. MP213Fo TaxID=3022250 RepID=UPI003BA08790